MIARQLRPEDGCLRFWRVGLYHPWQQVEPRFIHEDQHPALVPRSLPQLQPDLAPPVLDDLLVTLQGPPDRNLWRPAQFLEQTGDMALVIGDPEFLFDHLGDAGAGPGLASKPVGFRTMPEEFGDQSALGGREFRGMPRSGMGEERLGASGTCASEPAADRVLGHTESLGDVALTPALLLQLQCPKPSPFAPIFSGGAVGKHPAILAA